jgi:hypothetical protein
MVTTVTKAIKPNGGGDYASLSGWDIGQRANITASGNDTIQIAEIYSDPTQTGAGNVTLSNANWTVDATHYIIIRAAAGHECGGVWNTLKAFMGFFQNWSVGYVHIGPGLSTRQLRTDYVSCNTPCMVERCVVRDDAYGILFATGGGTGTHIVKNCVIYEWTNGYGGLSGVYGPGTKINVSNCTIHIPAAGFTALGPGSAITSQNNYLAVVSPVVCYYGGVVQGVNDATNNTEATTASLRNIAYSTANFVNVTTGSQDLHLKTGSALLLRGATIASVTNDIDGDSRVGFVFDIGADQFDQIPLCWNYTARYKNSNKLFKASGCGNFPKSLRVPENVDTSTGRMIDDGILINPDEYEIV